MQAVSTIPGTPFSLSPSPVALYITPSIRAAIHKTRFVIDNRQGLTALLGDVGMGKSSLLRLLASDYAAREDVRVALITQPSYRSDYAFVKAVAAEFDLPGKRSLYDQARALQDFLAAEFSANRNAVLFIDEAQKLSDEMLEQIRGFLNFETNTAKLLQVVLSGQLELKERLSRSTHRAIRSRVFAPSLLAPLSPSETVEMLRHRCELAGISLPFSAPSLSRIYALTAGIPRETLKLASLCYEVMGISGASEVSAELVDNLADEFRLSEAV